MALQFRSFPKNKYFLSNIGVLWLIKILLKIVYLKYSLSPFIFTLQRSCFWSQEAPAPESSCRSRQNTQLGTRSPALGWGTGQSVGNTNPHFGNAARAPTSVINQFPIMPSTRRQEFWIKTHRCLGSERCTLYSDHSVQRGRVAVTLLLLIKRGKRTPLSQIPLFHGGSQVSCMGCRCLPTNAGFMLSGQAAI